MFPPSLLPLAAMINYSAHETAVLFAPSPTGFLHIGEARTALFNWLYARHTGGTLVLRIKDTDVARNSQEDVDVILKGLHLASALTWFTVPDPSRPRFKMQRQLGRQPAQFYPKSAHTTT